MSRSITSSRSIAAAQAPPAPEPPPVPEVLPSASSSLTLVLPISPASGDAQGAPEASAELTLVP